ncbi:MAG: sugar transporter, partial [Bacteroidaceae bacterium]|nr:sugar transporter [Bacteroidaceae bacterium]
MNAKVNLLFYFLPFIFSFISRKVFLDSLGADFIGLTGTLGNILGYLNLAELGIGSCISYFLFKPLQEENREKIQELLSVFGYLYKRIGQAIGVIGIAISLLFPIIFEKEDISLGVIYFVFFSFLTSSLVGYFMNYRQILLTADQKNYLVSIYFQSAALVKTAIQITVAYYWGNPYVWALIELAFGFIGCAVLNYKINREYPWLRTDKAQGKLLMKQYPEIIKNTKQIFIHKIKDFILTQSDEILIFAFVNLTMVAYFNNYKMIIRKLGAIFSAVLDGMGAGVGNLVAEGNKANIMKVFWELMAIRYFIGAFLCFNLYML